MSTKLTIVLPDDIAASLLDQAHSASFARRATIAAPTLAAEYVRAAVLARVPADHPARIAGPATVRADVAPPQRRTVDPSYPLKEELVANVVRIAASRPDVDPIVSDANAALRHSRRRAGLDPDTGLPVESGTRLAPSADGRMNTGKEPEVKP